MKNAKKQIILIVLIILAVIACTLAFFASNKEINAFAYRRDKNSISDYAVSSLDSATIYSDMIGDYYKDEVTIYNGKEIEIKRYIDDYTDEDRERKHKLVADLYPDAILLAPATKLYNCHSYAWYENGTTNTCWIDNPIDFYSTGGYKEVSDPQVGDIICYINADGVNIHSGVVVELDPTKVGLSSIIVISKWGANALYKHAANYCYYYDYECEYITYYQRDGYVYNHIHEFGFRYEQVYEEVADEQYVSNGQYHNIHCICGDYITQAHTYTYGDFTETNHTKECICGYSVEEEHEIVKSTYKNTAYHGSRCACGAMVDKLHEYGDNEYEYVNKLNHRRRCEVCNTYVLSRHAIKASEGYDHCAYCGGALDSGEYYPALPNAQNRTPTGSYILPNGIIVLVDEDIEAYENGTLKFYSDLPEVQIN